MTAATSLPERGLLRLEEWIRWATKEPDLFRFADPSLDLTADCTVRHPGAEEKPGVTPRPKLLPVSRLRKRVERTAAGAAPAI